MKREKSQQGLRRYMTKYELSRLYPLQLMQLNWRLLRVSGFRLSQRVVIDRVLYGVWGVNFVGRRRHHWTRPTAWGTTLRCSASFPDDGGIHSNVVTNPCTYPFPEWPPGGHVTQLGPVRPEILGEECDERQRRNDAAQDKKPRKPLEVEPRCLEGTVLEFAGDFISEKFLLQPIQQPRLGSI